ncbi:hypothetical protein SEA_DAUBENSKI_55 [Streptomyces phage Daubenski]|uniref:Uncharacterized protein n=1 Tax=Streptomyces phage Daubenski TaxID=2653725 RepID=A0A5Q2WI58_9CAUD|nr:hypothetical protein KNU80_gp211 [Streptomyces phage Daubenski]QGH76363.1 hypothetical protein SEA_DAUBENSKI_55 [Streptomyces phage Daubenski]
MATAKGKAFLAVNADTVEASALAGFLTTLSTQVKTDANMGAVLNYTHDKLSQRFDAYMSAVAPASPNTFHHVYDWGHIGAPQYQLWKNVLRGRGSERYASFEFRASVLPVPLPEGDKVPFKRVHRFIYKAMIMEYNIGVTIKPKRAKILAFPVDDRIIFTRGPVFVQNPGGSATTGAFTAAWTNWWTGPGASQAFDEGIRRTLEGDFAERNMAKFMRRFKVARRKTGRISVADSRASFENGARLAEEFLQERLRKNVARRRGNAEL